MSIAVTEARKPQLSALAFVARGQWGARKSATEYSFVRLRPDCDVVV